MSSNIFKAEQDSDKFSSIFFVCLFFVLLFLFVCFFLCFFYVFFFFAFREHCACCTCNASPPLFFFQNPPPPALFPADQNGTDIVPTPAERALAEVKCQVHIL